MFCNLFNYFSKSTPTFESELFEACIEKAKQYGLEDDFVWVYRYYGNDAIASLEDWDLLDEEMVQKIKRIAEKYS